MAVVFDLDVLSHVLGTPKGELETSLKKEGEEEFLTGDELNNALRSYVDGKVIKTKLDAREKQVLGRAKREALTEFEKEIVTKFGISESSKKGLELIEHLHELGKLEALKANPTPDKIAALDEKDLFLLPNVQKILTNHTKERDLRIKSLEDETAKTKAEYDNYKTTIEVKESQKKIDGVLIGELEKLGVQFSEDSRKKQLQVNQFLLSVKQNEKFGFDEKGNTVPIGEDGNQLFRDSKYQTVADIVSDYNVLPKITVNDRIGSHSPSPNGQQAQKTAKRFTLPAEVLNDKTGNAFWKLHAAEKDEEIKKAMIEAYKAI